jgi:hypothetical protein
VPLSWSRADCCCCCCTAGLGAAVSGHDSSCMACCLLCKAISRGLGAALMHGARANVCCMRTSCTSRDCMHAARCGPCSAAPSPHMPGLLTPLHCKLAPAARAAASSSSVPLSCAKRAALFLQPAAARSHGWQKRGRLGTCAPGLPHALCWFGDEQRLQPAAQGHARYVCIAPNVQLCTLHAPCKQDGVTNRVGSCACQ